MSWLRLVLVIFAAGGIALPSMGCAHAVRIETTPPGAQVIVDGEHVGDGPVTVERRAWLGDQLHVVVEAENFERADVLVAQSEWFIWPGLIALTPLLGLSVVWIPFAGPVMTVIWAVVTSPTLFALTFTRRYPERVVVRLKPRITPDGVLVPSDIFTAPDDYSPNPPPEVHAPDDDDATPPPVTPQAAGANPVP